MVLRPRQDAASGVGLRRAGAFPEPKSVGIEKAGKHLAQETGAPYEAIEGRSPKDARAVRMLDQKARFSRKGFVRATSW